jgi:hypothetical protein
MSSKYNIDSSHSEKHSMDVLRFADENYQSQLEKCPYLEKQVNVIYTASVLHDMCDKKYMKQEQGIQEIEDFLKYSFKPEELHYTKQIIETMSYSTVKKNGYPDLGIYQQAYHIVREADLLASYDFDRSIIYHMNKGNTLTESYNNSLKLFNERMFNYNRDKLLLSEYALQKSLPLQGIAVKQMLSWNRILHKSQFK